jgi:hypothetical protein
MIDIKTEHIFHSVLEICESIASFPYYKCSEYFKSIPDSLEVCCLMVHG